MRGIEFEIAADAPELRPRAAVLSSVRVLRDYELQGNAPDEVMVEAPRQRQRNLVGARPSRWRRRIPALDLRESGDSAIQRAFPRRPPRALAFADSGVSRGEAPLVPLTILLTQRAGGDVRARDALSFLTYQDKFLAGSWRFNTYFGRDTLISALLLAPVLEPQAVESAIASVLDRLAPNGEVAHEEDIGEFAVLRNMREGRGRVATPVYDYGMVDDDFLLASLAASWM